MKSDPRLIGDPAQQQRQIIYRIDPPMSPRNDVNRSVKLATGLGPLQHKIALDSDFAGKESLPPFAGSKIWAKRQQLQKKRAPMKGALS
jgi:hypothetical protein